ncbi:hypothetical protein [Lactobacillus ultunensis]|uniref:Uncharacterized protein n=1 Tax=Lactobacillus ultunensis DSM 16047 TaxID=525365 RepID=C2EL86_9LACO|nr:hypothetical protein [Lactobacillus ultunensis]EEJ72736.1 hypothetical protein HMPREF0548_0432 [Lactobacillus ultunensis DSM 16047]KRL81299.1 hypothetical protein FC57_GL000621 [Lactobacillus ultunensis DSM 16047]QQP29048.1 hypothetical protein H4B44_03035 [Lactobacillus ultunensis]
MNKQFAFLVAATLEALSTTIVNNNHTVKADSIDPNEAINNTSKQAVSDQDVTDAQTKVAIDQQWITQTPNEANQAVDQAQNKLNDAKK